MLFLLYVNSFQAVGELTAPYLDAHSQTKHLIADSDTSRDLRNLLVLLAIR